MLHNLTKRKFDQKGFTIIEVLIVLAIAGLIMLVVFLAVPALQRNSRNTTLKNDASALSGAFQEYVSNNNGTNPASITQAGATVTVGAAGTVQASAQVNGSTTVVVAKTTPVAFAAGQLWWNTGKTCSGTATPRAITVYYYVESTTPPAAPSCIDA